MSDLVPEVWKFSSIGECCEILDSKRVPLNSEERAKRLGNYPYYGANGIQGYVDSFIFDGDAILVAEDGGNFDQYYERPIAQWVTGKYWVNNHAHIIRANENNLHKWIYYCLVHKNILKFINGGTRSKLNQSDLREIQIPIPTLSEQKKITSILTSVDEVIENTRKKINKLQDLKKSVMIDLMNKGINHKEFKDTKLGKIPKTWNIYKYNDLLKIVDNKMEMKDDKFYSLLSIRRRNGGVFSREKLIGKKILTKTLGKAVVNTFIISKMQIVHGASGYISEKFKDHYVSSSYTQFAAKDRNKINTKFLFYYSHLDKVYKQFLLSSHGVHIEKMTFDLKDWYKKEIILPNIEEQQEIVRIIESFENHISNTEKKLEKYNFFKKSLLQDLLTGKVRVSVN